MTPIMGLVQSSSSKRQRSCLGFFLLLSSLSFITWLQMIGVSYDVVGYVHEACMALVLLLL